MADEIKVYKVKDFLQKTKSGDIDYAKSIELVNELACVTSFHPDHDILVDLRDTTVEYTDFDSLLRISIHMASYKSVFKNKIANLIPNDPVRIKIAEEFRACLKLSGFHYEFFTDYEDAIKWLSDVSTLRKKE